MPVTASAKKALRRDRRREANNRPIRTRLGSLLNKAHADPSQDNIASAYRAIDRAAKAKVIHRKAAARYKSRLMRAIKRRQ